MPTSLVTGGAGFLGSHLCDYLLERGDRVICVDSLDTGSLKNIEHLRDPERFRFEMIDITSHYELDEPVDLVFHMASPASPIDYARLPLHTLKVGAYGTHNTLGLAKKHRARFLLGIDLRGLRRPARAPATRELLGQRQPDRPARGLRRGQALRGGPDDGLPAPAGRRHLHRAHLQLDPGRRADPLRRWPRAPPRARRAACRAACRALGGRRRLQERLRRPRDRPPSCLRASARRRARAGIRLGWEDGRGTGDVARRTSHRAAVLSGVDALRALDQGDGRPFRVRGGRRRRAAGQARERAASGRADRGRAANRSARTRSPSDRHAGCLALRRGRSLGLARRGFRPWTDSVGAAP